MFRFDIFLYLFLNAQIAIGNPDLPVLFGKTDSFVSPRKDKIDATITSANMIKTRNDVCIDKTSLKYMAFKTILSDLDAMIQADFT